MTLRVSRTRGAISGLLLVLLGAWGALVPFAGPSFGFAYTPDNAWAYTSGHLWLSLLPGVVTLLCGVILLMSQVRLVAITAACLAIAAGAWFAVGPVVITLWATGISPGSPVGGAAARAAEQLGFYTGLGVAIVFVAALALGRLSLVGVRDARLAESRRAAADAEADTEEVGAKA